MKFLFWNRVAIYKTLFYVKILGKKLNISEHSGITELYRKTITESKVI